MAKLHNLWTDRKSPVLERCSLDRASEMLNCLPSDFIALAEKGTIQLHRMLNGITGKARLVLDLDREPDVLDSLRKRLYLGARLGFISIDFNHLGDEIKIDRKHVLLIDLNVEAFGMWNITYLHGLNPYKKPHIFRHASLQEGVRLVHLNIPEQQVETKDVFIARDDMERLYASSISGLPLHSNEIDHSLDLDTEGTYKERVTIKQSDYIAALMNALGISPEEMKDGSINSIKNKLSRKAKQIPLPEVTDDTLTDWLKRAGKR